ncbi:hypothetical protein MMC10_011268 [Thelotrema lepadinum]|nr:hypothetical protein [Thelotrema lepadinum]
MATENGTEGQDTKPGSLVVNSKGHLLRQPSQFRDWVKSDPNAEFPAEKGRYVLYLNLGCPWAHRANIVHKLKGLQDVVRVVVMGYELVPGVGWTYDGKDGSAPCDPIYGFTKHSQLYYKADPNYAGRFTVPTLWDLKRETIVNNESSEIIRMFYTAFDAFIDPALRKTSRPLLPKDKLPAIDAMNEWVYDTVNNGVYKCIMASTQEAYDSSVHALFASLDRLEAHLATKGTPYLFGDHITEADIRLYTTIARFDVAYYTQFKCNLGMIRYDYPKLHDWLRRLYWDKSEETNGGAFGATTHFGPIKKGYAFSFGQPHRIVPAGPRVAILPLD